MQLIFAFFIFILSFEGAYAAETSKARIQLIQYLDAQKQYPPPIVWETVNTYLMQGVPAHRIVVVFDFHDTIALRTKNLSPQESNIVNATMIPRGGEAMKALLDRLQKAGVTFVVDSAASINGVAAEAKMIGLERYINTNKDAKNAAIPGTEGDSAVYLSGNIITGEQHYNKSHHIEGYLAQKDIDPVIVIFMDDSAFNVLNVYTHFLTRAPAINFIGIHVPASEYPAEKDFIRLLGLTNPSPKDLLPVTKIEFHEPGELENALKIKDMVSTKNYTDQYLQQCAYCLAILPEQASLSNKPAN